MVDRRLSVNQPLRTLVDALKHLIDARDALWRLSFLDRLFRHEKCRSTMTAYMQASTELREAINIFAVNTHTGSDPQKTDDAEAQAGAPNVFEPLLTVEEFEMLLGNPYAGQSGRK